MIQYDTESIPITHNTSYVFIFIPKNTRTPQRYGATAARRHASSCFSASLALNAVHSSGSPPPDASRERRSFSHLAETDTVKDTADTKGTPLRGHGQGGHALTFAGRFCTEHMSDFLQRL